MTKKFEFEGKHYGVIDGKAEEIERGSTINMTKLKNTGNPGKLKTLKNLQRKYVGDITLIEEEELKQEAIKWVKSKEMKGAMHFSARAWINYFFNITDEDLQ